MPQDPTQDSSTAVLVKPKLQAVILADTIFYNSSSAALQPLSLDRHNLLIPINNKPLVEYILQDFLITCNQVNEIIIVTACAETSLEDYLSNKSSKNNASTSNAAAATTNATTEYYWDNDSTTTVTVVKDTSLSNAGDALRELYKRNYIRSEKNDHGFVQPFILCYGDVVSNLNLGDVIDKHSTRHFKDSSALMTCIFKKVASDVARNPTINPIGHELCIGLVSEEEGSVDDEYHRIVYYETATSYSGKGTSSSKVDIPCTFIQQSQSPSSTSTSKGGLTLHENTLLYTGICICSPDVLGKFQDEFDYLEVEKDFITNCVAEEEDGLQTKIYGYVTQGGYSARLVDFKTYDVVSRDLLQRWGYPIVAENYSGGDKTTKKQRYKLVVQNNKKNNNNRHDKENTSTNNNSKYQYKEIHSTSNVGRSTHIYGPGIIGSGGTVGEHCTIDSCVVGHNVNVGNDCQIKNSHIWDDVVIETDVNIDSAVIGRGCVVRSGSTVPRGCVIGDNCIVGSNVTLPPFTRITLQKSDYDDGFGNDGFDDDFDNDDTNKQQKKNDDDDEDLTDYDVVGSDGKGRVWKPSIDDDDESDDDGDDDDDDGIERPKIDTWIELQSIGGDPTKYLQWREKVQAKAALEYEEEDDGFSDDDGEDDDFGATMMTESQAFTAYTDGAFTFGDADDVTPAAAIVSPTSANTQVIGRQKGVDVIKEMIEICVEFDETCFPMENLSIELNSYKFSQNATYGDCTMSATFAMLQKMDITPEVKDGRLVATLKTKLEEFWAPLLQKMSISVVEEISIIHAIEMAATNTGHAKTSTDTKLMKLIAEKLSNGMSFRFVLQTMHDEEVLSEEALLKWADERKQEVGSVQQESSARLELFRSQPVQDFLEWLEEESEEEDDDSDDDSE
jgi:translation initiation factor eIF-2B subunit epsilon